jgi:hypothetical protein
VDPLDQTSLLCDPFYVLKPLLGKDRKGHSIVEPGQFVLAHQVYPTAQPWVIEVKGYDPRDPSKNTYAFARYSSSASPPTHFPVKELNLRSDENLYIMYGKRRPALVIQTISTDFYNRQNPEPYVWVAPCFTFKEKHKAAYRVQVAARTSRRWQQFGRRLRYLSLHDATHRIADHRRIIPRLRTK